MKVVVDDLIVEYRDEGAGPVLLMLHGWGNTMQYFDTLCAELHGYRIIRLDLPGFGSSQEPPMPWDVSAYAAFVQHFCKKIGVQPDALVGHSFGGRIITKGVGTGVLHAQKLVLIGSAGVAQRKTARNILYAATAKVGKVILAPLPRSLYDGLRRLLYKQSGSDYLSIRGMKETFLHMIREDLSAYAQNITTPTLLIWGKDDQITPLAEGERLHTLISHSRLVVIPETGHFVYREAPEAVAKLIVEFV